MREIFILSLLASVFWVPLTRAQSLPRTLLVKGPEELVLENLKNFSSKARIVRSFPQIGWVVVKSDTEETALQVKADLQRHKSIYATEENLIWNQIAVPTDRKYSSQRNEISRTELEAAWNLTTGSPDTLIAVIDSGIAADHPDLKNRLWKNPDESPNGIDDDRNGFVDDIYGWDFVNDDATPEDGSSHGTHVAGIIGAEGNNRIGIAGVNWNCRIMALRTLNDRGSGGTDAAVEAVLYAVSKGARLINASWGGYQHSQALQDALQYATDEGILIVAAAGNNALDSDREFFYPASYPVDGVLAVASSEARGRLSSFSNFGRFSVDVVAPGSEIYSTIPQDGYARKSGTSMASPFVAGVAGLLLSMDSSLSPRQLKNALMNATTPYSLFEDRVSTGGELNAKAAVEQLNSSFQIWPRRASIRVGDRLPLSSYAARDPVVWTVSDSSLAEVNPLGEVIGLAKGRITVTGVSGSFSQSSQITIGEFKSSGCGNSSKTTMSIQAATPLGLILAFPFCFLFELRAQGTRRIRKLFERQRGRSTKNTSN